jgi:hypothetical protein
MLVVYKLQGISRKIIQLLFVGMLLVEFYTLFLFFTSSVRDIFVIFMVFLFGIILKYLQGYLVYRIEIDVTNDIMWLNRTWGKQLLLSKNVKEWGYRIIVTEAEYISRTKNLELYLHTGRKIVYPFNLFGKKPSDKFKQALIDCLGSTPRTYSMKFFTMESDVLFVLL